MRDPMLETAVDTAKRIGTYGKRDRSLQYRDNSGPALLRSNNHLWVEIRTLKLMVWILGGALTGCVGLIGWLATELLARLH